MSDPDVPLFDDAGINLADPHDRRGRKTAYISELQVEAIRRALGDARGHALDVGCGYGRLTQKLQLLGFDRVTGVDPSESVITAARGLTPGVEFRVGAMPDLQVDENVSTLFLLNVLRALHLLGKAQLASSLPGLLRRSGRIVVIDNLRAGHPNYLSEVALTDLFVGHGMRLVYRRAIRGARWPWVYLIRYGLLPKRWHAAVARFELRWMRWFQHAPRWQYVNVLWVFEKQ